MKKKLLLADDSVTIQKVVQITFSHDDYELTVVDNGDIAYEKARQQRPDLILADVFMPGKNGYELCAAVKNDPSLSAVPVLLLTGTFEPFDEAKAKSVGADRWIAKPFESQALIACVEDLLTIAAQAPLAAAAPQPLTPIVPPSAPEEVADFSDDIWGNDLAVESSDISAEPLATEAFAPPSQDDLWDVSGFESETPIEPAIPPAEDLWGSFDPPANSVEEEAIVSAAVIREEEMDPWGSDDFPNTFPAEVESPAPETFSLENVETVPAGEVEILEEIDLLEPFAESPAELTAIDDFADSDLSFAEMTGQSEPVAVPVTIAPPLPIVAPAPLSVNDLAQAQAVPLPAAPSYQGTAISNDQLEQIVERVAEVVISRLAGTLLEKIAWEVVPDLAETMIKEELRKIRESVTVD